MERNKPPLFLWNICKVYSVSVTKKAHKFSSVRCVGVTLELECRSLEKYYCSSLTFLILLNAFRGEKRPIPVFRFITMLLLYY